MPFAGCCAVQDLGVCFIDDSDGWVWFVLCKCWAGCLAQAGGESRIEYYQTKTKFLNRKSANRDAEEVDVESTHHFDE